jgi:hypothetical protein
MQSLYTETGLKAIHDRIGRLRPDSKPLWGKMNAGQMLAHLRMTMEVPLGSHQLKPMFIMKLIGGMIRKRILSDKPLSKNSPTASTLVVADDRDFEKEKQELRKTLQSFSEKGRKGEMPEKHPYFGKMSAADWDLFQQRHLEHHLGQFGV